MCGLKIFDNFLYPCDLLTTYTDFEMVKTDLNITYNDFFSFWWNERQHQTQKQLLEGKVTHLKRILNGNYSLVTHQTVVLVAHTAFNQGIAIACIIF